MKYFSIAILSVLLLGACNSSCDKDAVEEIVVNEDVVADAETKLAVEGMVCSMGCVATIQNELLNTPGVAFATVNYEESFATIKYDSKIVNEEELIAAIESIGDHAYSAGMYEGHDEDHDMEVHETMEVMEAVETVVAH